jgi:uncharacterized protein (TIGR03790 family)
MDLRLRSVEMKNSGAFRWGAIFWVVCVGIPLFAGQGLRAASLSEGASVVVLYNQNVPDSLAVAEHYAAKRGVPKEQLVGLDLPKGETVSRQVFTDQLENPLRKRFRDESWFEFDFEVIPASRERVGQVIQSIKKATVRYLAICYGVPLRIQPDADFKEDGSDKLRIELRRNEAAVDSELAVLPLDPKQRRIYGPLSNPVYGATNAVSIRPEMGILMVSRLDGPTVEIAKGLVDLAMEAEEDGLWGRAYFDLRGITSGEYKLGDDWIARAAEFSRQVGLETYVDNEGSTFPATLPMSHIGLYAGWYDTHVSGPFSLPDVDFMPGAVGYHLHSYSAQTIRSKSQHWVGPLLDRGVTATMGCVYEPYLALTPNLELFFSRLFLGYGFAEAAYASQQAVSWQTTVVGDPLYRPFAKPLNMLQADLAAKKSRLTEWLGMMNVNRALLNNTPVGEVAKLMSSDTGVQMSAVLTEKLADLYREDGQREQSEEIYRRALKLKPNRHQALRIRLRLAAMLRIDQAGAAAVKACLAIAEKHPDYVGVVDLLKDALVIARRTDEVDLVSKVEALLSPLVESKDAK